MGRHLGSMEYGWTESWGRIAALLVPWLQLKPNYNCSRPSRKTQPHRTQICLYPTDCVGFSTVNGRGSCNLTDWDHRPKLGCYLHKGTDTSCHRSRNAPRLRFEGMPHHRLLGCSCLRTGVHMDRGVYLKGFIGNLRVTAMQWWYTVYQHTRHNVLSAHMADKAAYAKDFRCQNRDVISTNIHSNSKQSQERHPVAETSFYELDCTNI